MPFRWLTATFVLAIRLAGEPIGSTVPRMTRLLQFIQWPGGGVRGENIIVGLAGYSTPPEFYGKRAASARLEFRVVHTAKQMRDCHVVVFGPLPPQRVENLLQAIQGRPVLTVGAVPGFARMGGMVELPLVSESRRLTVNLDLLRRAGLRIDPGLMSVTEIFRPE